MIVAQRLSLPIVLAAVALAACTPAEKPAAAASPTSGDVPVAVTEEGFVPSTVTAQKGKPLALVFTRTADHTCATAVAFPELKLEKPLPKGSPVRIELPTADARTYTFQCGMGMYKSKVVIQ